jgi:hypothetical protein
MHLAIGSEHIKKAFLDAKSRGARLRYLTDITIASLHAIYILILQCVTCHN